MARPPIGAGQCRAPVMRKTSPSKQCKIQSKKNQVRQSPPAAAKISKRTWPNETATSQPRSGRGARPTYGLRKPSSHHHGRSASHVHRRPGPSATRGFQPPQRLPLAQVADVSIFHHLGARGRPLSIARDLNAAADRSRRAGPSRGTKKKKLSHAKLLCSWRTQKPHQQPVFIILPHSLCA